MLFATQPKLRILYLLVLRQFHRLHFVWGQVINVTAINVVPVLTEVCVCVSVVRFCVCVGRVHVLCVFVCPVCVWLGGVCVGVVTRDTGDKPCHGR